MEDTISYTNMLPSEENLANSLLCFIDQTNDSCLYTALKNYSSRISFHKLNHNQDRKEAFMCHSVPVFLRVCFNPWPYAMSYSDATKRAASMHPLCVFFVLKMCLTPKSVTNTLCREVYTIFPLSLYYKKKQHLAVTYLNRGQFLCTSYLSNTHTHSHDYTALQHQTFKLSFLRSMVFTNID
jgi:hypothetical protein